MKSAAKKIICFALSTALLSLSLAGCGKSTEPPASDNENITGGWVYTTEFTQPAIPEDAQKAFDEAGGADKAGYKVAAYLGSQVVSGINHAFLCTGNDALSVVSVYADLDGNASILETTPIDITKYTENQDIDFSAMTGKYTAENAVGTKLGDDAQAAFDKAISGMLGVNYEPLACLGTQLVSGTNYAILCKATSVTAQPQSALAVVVVYASLDGNAEVTSICGFDL